MKKTESIRTSEANRQACEVCGATNLETNTRRIGEERTRLGKYTIWRATRRRVDPSYFTSALAYKVVGFEYLIGKRVCWECYEPFVKALNR